MRSLQMDTMRTTLTGGSSLAKDRRERQRRSLGSDRGRSCGPNIQWRMWRLCLLQIKQDQSV
ncbi:hypothetical protein QJS10_CPA01g02558 [Acorus calamus]|uniref:Uncharacterized protein n=1 Tax=Acorus calamus TaxID=4465 RepID=A0AAV9FMR5_ACOCL|nr:hypothetical protein QJS10_CPA01g02558 [Acorus calamus]